MTKYISTIKLQIALFIIASLTSSILAQDSLHIRTQSNLVDSINTVWDGQTFWFNKNIIGYYDYQKLSSFHFGGLTDQKDPDRLSGLYANSNSTPSIYEWPIKGAQRFSQGMIGGESWAFFKGKFVGIIYRPPVYYEFEIGYNEKKQQKEIEMFGALVPYIRIVPDSATYYSAGPDYGKKFLGANIRDTIFIPFTENKIQFFLSDRQLNDFKNIFRKSEQEAWNAHMARYRNRYQALIKVYGKESADIISKGEVRFGFTKEMCNLAYDGEPYRPSYNVETPLGLADSRIFYTKGITLYFIDDLLIGIKWKDGKVKFK